MEQQAAGDMPPALRNKVNAQIAALWPDIQADEAQYITTHPQYWQGLSTHQTAIPVDGTDVLPDVGTETPTDVLEPWPVDLVDGPIAVALAVHPYLGPLGPGYVLVCACDVSSPGGPAAHWVRTINVGPETWREHDWEWYTPLFEAA